MKYWWKIGETLVQDWWNTGETLLTQLRKRVLSQVKGIERSKHGRRSSVCSERSIYSGVGTVRKRSENEDEEEKSAKNPKTQAKSFLPAPKTK